MSGPRLHLGDSHNFGRRVVRRAGRVAKPRTIVWEGLLLDGKSPLRRLLDEAASESGAEGAFGFLPDLAFSPSPDGVSGEVEAIALEPLGALSDDERRGLARIVGRAVALFSWLGVADLHWENLVLGHDARGRVVFAPLDVEMILAELTMPTETKLLPDADPEYAAVCQHAAGVRRVLPYLGKPVDPADLVAMAAAYQAALALLERNAPRIAQVFAELPALRETPIRVCLRGTDEYVQAGSEALWPPLLDAESEQLERGDIPYFFRLYGRRGIHYYSEPTLREWKTLPVEGDVPQLDPMLVVERGLVAPSRGQLREPGLFALLGAFDHPSFSGRHAADELEVTFRSRSLVVRLPSGEELESARNLRAFVESVYLPCRCGEVRAVFVPEVTVCEAEPGFTARTKARLPREPEAKPKGRVPGGPAARSRPPRRR